VPGARKPGQGEDSLGPSYQGFSRALFLVCLLKVGLAAVGAAAALLWGYPLAPRPVNPAPLLLLESVAYVATGLYLHLAGTGDRRAQALGLFLALAGSSFTPALIKPAAQALDPSLGPALHLVRGLAADSLLPWALWLFVRDFPKAPLGRLPRTLAQLATQVSLVVGACAGIVQTASVLLGGAWPERWGGIASIARVLARNYYPILFLLSTPALPWMLARARQAPLLERRRVLLFTFALLLGFVPVTAYILGCVVFPGLPKLPGHPAGRALLNILVVGPILTVPFTLGYAVVVQRVLEVRLVIRRALQYLLARTSLTAIAVAPFALLIGHVWTRRSVTVAELLSDAQPLSLLAFSVLAVVALTTRTRSLSWVDRKFFREQHDARLILSDLSRRSRGVVSVTELGRLLESEIDRALHLDAVAVLVLNPRTSRLESSSSATRPLDVPSALADLLASSAEPFSVDLSRPGSLVSTLPEPDRLWIAEGGFQMLVPMIAADGSLVGVAALGEKKSELPFQREDRQLLSAIAASVAPSIENRLLRSSSFGSSEPRVSEPTRPETAAAEEARLCPRCGKVFPPSTPECPLDGPVLESAGLAHVVSGKYRLERRIGAGGMGVVYKAFDLGLGRMVALKALPRVSPELALRLRREARAAAALCHPNLAVIHAAESSFGVPILVFELLEGGTLASRLEQGPLHPGEVVNLGIDLASAIEVVHDAGILHRDLKPANVGYTASGVVKILDFGLSRIIGDLRSEALGAVRSPAAVLSDSSWNVAWTRSDVVVGTIGYISPEAAIGEPPDPMFDVWSLSVLLYEAATGRNPLLGGSAMDVFHRTLEGPIPDPLTLAPALPRPMAELLHRALSRNRRLRPQSARELRLSLEAVRWKL
jgi:GAF domain-containing protein